MLWDYHRACITLLITLQCNHTALIDHITMQPHTHLMLLQYANDFDTAVKIWDLKTGRCVWSVNEKSVLSVYKLYVTSASSTIFIGHSLGRVSVYQFHDERAGELGRRTVYADEPKTIPSAAVSSRSFPSASSLNDLGLVITDEGSFQCHSSSGNIVSKPRLPTRARTQFLTAVLQRCLVASSKGRKFFTSAFDDSLDRSIKSWDRQNERPLNIANTKVVGVLYALHPSPMRPLCATSQPDTEPIPSSTGNACKSLGAHKR